MKKIIIALSILFLFAPIFANAQVDSKCFTKEQCVQLRTQYKSQTPNEGFFEKPDPKNGCGKVPVGSITGTPGEVMGFCLPASETKTQVKFGGRQNFANIGDFLKYIYKYGVMVAGILATLMVIVAGFQWVASGGNAATIGSAKKRIFGAIIGLVLAVGSFTLLETINPALVELRLPNVWMINRIALGANYCSLIKTPVALALPKSQKQQLLLLKSQSTSALTPEAKVLAEQRITKEEQRINQLKIDGLNKIQTNGYNVDPQKTECGSDYFVQGAGSSTCVGAICSERNKACVPFDTNINNFIQTGIHRVHEKIPESACWDGVLIMHYKVEQSLWELAKRSTLEDVVTLEQSDNGDDRWLEDPSNLSGDEDYQMTVRIYPVCEGEVTGDNYKEVTPEFETLNSSNSFYEYVLKFKESMFVQAAVQCPSGSKAYGFMIMNQININLTPKDAYIFVVKSGDRTASAHLWCEKPGSWQNNVIPIESVIGNSQKSLFLELTITESLISQTYSILDDSVRDVPGDTCN
ncbi:MAG: pilin [Candidatus Magasanikbacteria bacterium]|nr:pilin [Candidatus Magasanikbacteria bacterium]